ncbi:MAG TPA: response regulator transcription factor [Chloroflexota bacterium]|nr:response regulator transcription factor [Chloroflexota bacterium]
MLVDEQPIRLAALRGCLEETGEFAVVGMGLAGRDALSLVATHQPEVLVLDAHLPDMSSLDFARQVRQAGPLVAVVVLTGPRPTGEPRVLDEIGVRGSISKRVSGEEFVGAVRTVARGGTVFVPRPAPPPADITVVRLTRREHEVLELLASAQTNASIAATLVLSEKTVEFHVQNLCTKLGVWSRLAAVMEAQRRGLLAPAQPVPHGLRARAQRNAATPASAASYAFRGASRS